MSNSRSRKKIGSNKNEPTFMGNGNYNKTKNKKRRKNLPLPRYVTFSDESTPESKLKYWKKYLKQELEIQKNRKYNRQNKGIQKPYKMHSIIKNLTDCNY